MPVKPILGGEPIEGGETLPVEDPSTGQVFEEVYALSREQVRGAIEAADEAFARFSRMSLRERARVLERAAGIMEERREELALLLAREAGKPIRDARVEVLRAISVFRIAAGEAHLVLEGRLHRVDYYEYPPGNERRRVMEYRQPLGVVAAILPFNFPLNSMAHKVAPNLAVGNTVVVKPSASTPLSAIELARILYDAGLPRGVLSVVTGKASVVGEELLTNPRVRGLTFTGSTEVGLQLASKAVGRGMRIAMELGGSDPFIVFEDADLEKAVRTAVRARFEYAGQNCNAGKRFIVQEGVYEEFSRRMAELARGLRLGPATSEETDMGPVISRDAQREMLEVIEDLRNRGAEIIAGGRIPGELQGYFVEPTVAKDVPPDAHAFSEEVFGPVAPIVPFKSEEEAIELANRTPYGLQAAVFTRDLRRALRVAEALEAGAVIVNDSTRLRWDALPFGGVKLSGVGGREGVRVTMLNFTEPKLVSFEL